MTKPPVLILGARSDIGRAVAHAFAAEGHPIQLAARNAESLQPDATDITIRYNVAASVHDFDALDTAHHAAFLDHLPTLPEVAVCAVGLMGDQAENETDAGKAALVIRANFEGPALILGDLANRFAARGSGTLVGISSVAGDRGRATNYVYGASKAGFTAFLSGLRNRLAKQGVHVVTVLPGFVNTRMTEGMDLPGGLTAEPQELGTAIVKAVEKKRNIIYVRPVWRLIMAIIRAIPEAVFKKLSL
ncbi:Sorbitol-6-phosphate 2-dehydrogenase [Rhodovulum sp. P5]|uniref:SDR family oxidoreductase n=1 Tax=Rhodovulum sp. P5 TaxID=1564506 RepID=UPI0009C38179|nr:SDR family oxidoreductase [Rhodovulum sp. P5]ARE40843.1 Sorbitol-6-phosphate 2-dehydrogenase [Rhodovulum sp. P5]